MLHSNQHVKRIPLSNYHVNSDDFYLTLFKINLFLWRHFDISSVSIEILGLPGQTIIIFSVRHKSHLLVPHLYRDDLYRDNTYINNHTQSFRHISHINDTELSKYLWTLKANGTDYHLKWSIKSYAS